MVLPKGSRITDFLKIFPGLKNPVGLKQPLKDMPIIQRIKPSMVIPRSPPKHEEKEDPNIIKAHIPDLIRSYETFPNGLKNVLENNRKWANTKRLREMKFFENLANEKPIPKLYWIGCSDSRVVPETISQLGFGQLFVHRNIANQFNANDLNCMSELEFAVHNVKVEHIIVCGHTKCIGVVSACNDDLHPNLKTWLSDIRKIKDSYPELFPDHVSESRMTKSEKDRLHKKLVEINVTNQVKKIASNEVIQEAWKDAKRKLAIHGWIFNMENGHLEDIGVTVGK